jgi:hypothetical protein
VNLRPLRIRLLGTSSCLAMFHKRLPRRSSKSNDLSAIVLRPSSSATISFEMAPKKPTRDSAEGSLALIPSHTGDQAGSIPTQQMLLDLDHNNETPACDKQSHFSRLSRELRDYIYDYLWQDVIMGFRQNENIVVARFSKQNLGPQPSGFPQWPQVCGQMRSEGITHFYATACFSIGEVDRLPAYGHGHFLFGGHDWSKPWTSYLDNHMVESWSPVSVHHQEKPLRPASVEKCSAAESLRGGDNVERTLSGQKPVSNAFRRDMLRRLL